MSRIVEAVRRFGQVDHNQRDQVDFRAALRILFTTIGNVGASNVLRKNNQLASRLTPANATHMVNIGVHVAGFGLDAGDILRTIVNKSVPMINKLDKLEAHVRSLDTKAKIEAFVKSCKGDAKKRALFAKGL